MPVLAFSRRSLAQRVAELDDRDLLLRMADGESGAGSEAELALDELVRRKTQALVSVAYRILGDREEAKDVAQVAFVRIWDHRDRYCDRWSPNTWTYRITTNLAIDHLRSRQSRERMHEPLKLQLRHRQESSSARMLSELREQEVASIFEELAEELAEKQRAVFVLREVEGIPSPEVAEIVGCRQSTVRNHLFNARRLLRSLLLERYPEYAPAADVEAHDDDPALSGRREGP